MNESNPPMRPVQNSTEPGKARRNPTWDLVIVLIGVALALVWLLSGLEWTVKLGITVVGVLVVVAGERFLPKTFTRRSAQR